MNKARLIPLVLEITGIAAIGTGIGVELATRADTGWAAITIGSCLVAIGGVIWGKFMQRGDDRKT
jgi:hypothetical protein